MKLVIILEARFLTTSQSVLHTKEVFNTFKPAA